MHAVLMSAFAMMFFQHASLLEFQKRMKEKKGKSNLETIFGVKDIPSDTQMREILDGVETEELRKLLPDIFEKMRRAGWTSRYVSKINGENYYTVAIDGSEYFHSTKIECPGCLRKEYVKGQIHYSHVIVAATIVKANTHLVLPLDVEEVKNEDGTIKQDCEICAAKRLVERIRQEHRQLSICIIADDIYSHEPFVMELRKKRMEFLLVAKPTSHTELFLHLEDLNTNSIEKGNWIEGSGTKTRHFEYRIGKALELTQSGKVVVNFLEVWQTNNEGKLLYHNSWITDFEVSKENIAHLVAIGRSRWKIENEHFNVHKNHGYELEHNFGHGKETLSMVFYLLNLLAFIAHLVLDFGDRLYLQCRDRLSRRSLWQDFRTLFDRILFGTWSDLLKFYLNDYNTASAIP